MKREPMRKGAKLLLLALILGMAACNKEKKPVTEEVTPTVSQEKEQEDIVSGDVSGENVTPSVVTPAPELMDAVADILGSVRTEQAERTAMVVLSDAGIQIDGTGCEAEENRLKIKNAGVYEISGSLSDGSIYVNADNESEVHLILNGVSVHNETGAALYCKKASKVTVTLAEGSENSLSDGGAYVLAEGEDEPDATLYAKHDLVLNGTGSLLVESVFTDGIKGKDSLYILEGTYSVTAADDGIVGRDLLYVSGGNITVTSAGDALKSSNDTDGTLGNILIDNGAFSLASQKDGIQAENTVTINGGSFTIQSGGGSANATGKKDDMGFGGGRGMWGDWQTGNQTTEDTESAKGIKANNGVTIAGGTFSLDCQDDGVHSNQDVLIAGGVFEISTGDDGMHADNRLTLENGCRVNVTKSYEGLEAMYIDVNGGEISVTASDDGLNAAGGADGSGFGFGGQGGGFGAGEGEITVNGGTLTVNGSGDGIDSNGNVTINGGSILVFGPTSGGNGVLDFGSNFVINGGSLFAIGGSDMAQTPSASSAQYSLAAVTASYAEAGSTVEIAVDGETVFSVKVTKRANYIIASSGKFGKEKEVTILVNGKEVVSGALTDIVTGFGITPGQGFGGGMNGNRGDGFDGFKPGKGEHGNGGMRPQMPEGFDGQMPERPQGGRPQMPEGFENGMPDWSIPEAPAEGESV